MDITIFWTTTFYSNLSQPAKDLLERYLPAAQKTRVLDYLSITHTAPLFFFPNEIATRTELAKALKAASDSWDSATKDYIRADNTNRKILKLFAGEAVEPTGNLTTRLVLDPEGRLWMLAQAAAEYLKDESKLLAQVSYLNPAHSRTTEKYLRDELLGADNYKRIFANN